MTYQKTKFPSRWRKRPRNGGPPPEIIASEIGVWSFGKTSFMMRMKGFPPFWSRREYGGGAERYIDLFYHPEPHPDALSLNPSLQHLGSWEHGRTSLLRRLLGWPNYWTRHAYGVTDHPFTDIYYHTKPKSGR